MERGKVIKTGSVEITSWRKKMKSNTTQLKRINSACGDERLNLGHSWWRIWGSSKCKRNEIRGSDISEDALIILCG